MSCHYCYVLEVSHVVEIVRCSSDTCVHLLGCAYDKSDIAVCGLVVRLSKKMILDCVGVVGGRWCVAIDGVGCVGLGTVGL